MIGINKIKDVTGRKILLAAMILIVVSVWLFVIVITNIPLTKTNKISAKVTSNKNLATENNEENEKIPLVGENFEAYQFKDPFMPLSRAAAPAENLPRTPSTTSSTSSTETGSNTAPSLKINAKVIKVVNNNNQPVATLRIDGKTVQAKEGQIVEGYKVIDINLAENKVDLLEGDQKHTITSTD